MSFKDLDIKISYISCGDDNFARSFIVPALKCTKLYRRSVGFFSSGVIESIIDGVVALSRNGGRIELIASPKLREDDIAAINAGYKQREEIVKRSFSQDFINYIEELDNLNLQLLAELIANGTLDIKIAITETLGDYHDKFGIMEDFEGNTIAFYGSANSSINGYKNNYEKIRVAKSWYPDGNESVTDEKKEFESLWEGTNPFVNVYCYTEIARENILYVIKRRSKRREELEPIKLRDYQEEAINAWASNNFHGFYVMATGTGKTWTAIFSAKRLLETKSAMIVICAPYKHLINQWAQDVAKIFSKSKIIMVSSENPAWKQELPREIIRSRYNPTNQIIIT